MTEIRHTPLGDLELVCGEIFDRWDKDMRSGKLLTALSGIMSPGYDPRVDRIRSALAAAPELLEALKALVVIYDDEFGIVAPEMNAALAAISKATHDQ